MFNDDLFMLVIYKCCLFTILGDMWISDPKPMMEMDVDWFTDWFANWWFIEVNGIMNGDFTWYIRALRMCHLFYYYYETI